MPPKPQILTLEQADSLLFPATSPAAGPQLLSWEQADSLLFPEQTAQPQAITLRDQLDAQAAAPEAEGPWYSDENIYSALRGEGRTALEVGLSSMYKGAVKDLPSMIFSGMEAMADVAGNLAVPFADDAGRPIDQEPNPIVRGLKKFSALARQSRETVERDILPNAAAPAEIGKDGVAKWMAELAGSGMATTLPGMVLGGGAGVAGRALNLTVKQAAALGMGTAAAASFPMNVGEAKTQFEQEGLDPKAASAWAVGIGPIITALDVYGLDRMGVFGKEAEVIKKSIVGHVARQVAQGGVGEATTEALQSGVREGVAAALSGNLDLEKRLWNTFEEAVAGGLVGGGISGGVAALPRPKGLAESAAETADVETPITPADDASPIPNELIAEGRRVEAEAIASPEINTFLKEYGLPDFQTPAVWQQGDQSQPVRVVDYIPGEAGAAPSIMVEVEGTGSREQVPLPLKDQRIVSREAAEAEAKAQQEIDKDIEQAVKEQEKRVKEEAKAAKEDQAVEAEIGKAADEQQKKEETAKAEVADAKEYDAEMTQTVKDLDGAGLDGLKTAHEAMKQEGYDNIRDMPADRRKKLLGGLQDQVKTKRQETEDFKKKATQEKADKADTQRFEEEIEKVTHGADIGFDLDLAPQIKKELEREGFESIQDVPKERRKTVLKSLRDYVSEQGKAAVARQEDEKRAAEKKPAPAKPKPAPPAKSDKWDKLTEKKGAAIVNFKPTGEKPLGWGDIPRVNKGQSATYTFETADIDGKKWWTNGQALFQGDAPGKGKASKLNLGSKLAEFQAGMETEISPIAYGRGADKEVRFIKGVVFFDELENDGIDERLYSYAIETYGQNLKFKVSDTKEKRPIGVFKGDEIVGIIMPLRYTGKYPNLKKLRIISPAKPSGPQKTGPQKTVPAKTVPAKKPLNLIDTPTGKFIFAGAVPSDLVYRMKDGSPLSDEMARDVQQMGPGLFKNQVEQIAYDSAEEATAAAKKLGYEVKTTTSKTAPAPETKPESDLEAEKLPNLKGTPKQRDWAVNLRSEALKLADKQIQEYKTKQLTGDEITVGREKIAQFAAAARSTFSKRTLSKYWITRRSDPTADFRRDIEIAVANAARAASSQAAIERDTAPAPEAKPKPDKARIRYERTPEGRVRVVTEPVTAPAPKPAIPFQKEKIADIEAEIAKIKDEPMPVFAALVARMASPILPFSKLAQGPTNRSLEGQFDDGRYQELVYDNKDKGLWVRAGKRWGVLSNSRQYLVTEFKRRLRDASDAGRQEQPGAGRRPEPDGKGRPPGDAAPLEGVSPETVPVPAKPGSAPGSREAGDRKPRADVLDPDKKGSGTAGGRNPRPRVPHQTTERGPAADTGAGTSPARPAGSPRRSSSSRRNFRISPDDDVGGRATDTQVFDANLAAIKLIKQLQEENRLATAEEQKVLVKYRGWGGLKNVFHGYDRTSVNRRDELKKYLPKDEYATAARSILNAHYTAPEVIKAMWAAAEHMGFSGGQVLEPASGVGHFLGLTPGRVAAKTKFTTVEMDATSAEITRQLYQRENVKHSRYEEVTLPESFYDLVISNVPFADVRPTDRKYNKSRMFLHDYYISKSLQLTRPGGLVMAISSKGTMDKRDSRPREVISKHGDLVGAFRLPEDAFKQNAGTTVTTDVLIFRRRVEGQEFAGAQPWIETDTVKMKIAKDVYGAKPEGNINEYYVANPKMLLGEMQIRRGRYGGGTETSMIKEPGTDVPAMMTARAENLPLDVLSQPVETPGQVTKKTIKVERLDVMAIPDGGITEIDGKLARRIGEKLDVLPETTPKQKSDAKTIRQMVAMTATLNELLSTQQDAGADPAKVKRIRTRLNKQYDALLTEKKQKGLTPIRESLKKFYDSRNPDTYKLLALEKWDETSLKGTKLAIFKRNTLAPPEAVEKPKNTNDALLQSLNQLGRVDVAWMAKNLGIEPKAVTDKLQGVIFRVPGQHWVTAEEYLSGNVREKLGEATAAAAVDDAYKPNVEALTTALPADVTPNNITAALGDTWMPPSDINQFIGEKMGIDPNAVDVIFVPEIGKYQVKWNDYNAEWTAKNSAAARQQWGTDYKSFFDLLNNALNGGFPKVTIEGDFQPAHTALARAKLIEIQDEFGEWVWRDDRRAERLSKLYNYERNNIALRQYNGDHLTFPGLSEEFRKTGGLRPHQRANVWRILSDKATYVGHGVGTGKTLILIAAAMEAKRLGIARRPVLAVPADKVDDFAKEFRQVYPAANILVAAVSRATTPVGRLKQKQVIQQIALGDWDAVIMNHDSFDTLKVSPQQMMKVMQEEMDMVEDAYKATKTEQGKSRGLARELEKKLEKLYQKYKDLEKRVKKSDVMSFEDSGIDMVLVDEAHHYKNLFFSSSFGREVRGLASRESGRATEFYGKTKLLHDTDGRIVMASGTPLSNSIGELYSLSRYMQPESLRQRGLEYFDNWANAYGTIREVVEYSAKGDGFKRVTKFANFKNFMQLMNMVYTFMDVKLAENVGEIKLPKLWRGMAQPVIVPRNPDQIEYQNEINERAEAISASPRDALPDNMLAVSSDGRVAAIDMRMISGTYPYVPGGKIDEAVSRVVDIYQQTTKFKGTQLVFLDRVGATKKNPDFAPHKEIIKRLVEEGIPRNQIASTGDVKGDREKSKKEFSKLYDRVNKGDIRVLLASSQKGGVGINMQELVGAIHHIDVDWNIAMYMQRNGRGLRQGNQAWDKHKWELRIFNYGTEKTVDAFMWSKVAYKEALFKKIMSGEINEQIVEDLGDAVVSPSQMVALTSGDPMVARQIKLEGDKKQLDIIKQGFESNMWSTKSKLQRYKREIPMMRRLADRFDQSGTVADKTTKIKGRSGETWTFPDRENIPDETVESWKKNIQRLIKENTDADGIAIVVPLAIVEHGDNVINLQLRVAKRADDIPSARIEVEGDQEWSGYSKLPALLARITERYQKQAIENRKSADHLEKHELPVLEKEATKAFPKQEELDKINQELNDIQATYDEKEQKSAERLEAQEEGADPDGTSAFAGETPTLPSLQEADRLSQPTGLIRKSDILRKLSTAFKNLPIRVGRFRKRGALGIYKGKTEAIRLKDALDIPVAAHEIGHHINKIMYGGPDGKLNFEPLKAFRDELIPIATPAGSGKSPLPEGFAEFIRLYLTRPGEAQKKAPKFYQEFEQQLNEFPDLREILTDAREQIKRYVEQPAAAKILAHISKEDTTLPSNRFQRLYAQTIDALHPIKVVVDSMAKHSGQPAPPTEQNAYEMSRIFAGWMGKAEHFLKRGTFHANSLKVEGKSLQDILQPLDGQLDNLRIYLTARRAVEKSSQGIKTGIDVKDAWAALRQVETPELKQAATDIYAYNDRLLAYLVETDYLSTEQFDAIKQMNENYVPLYRVMEGAPSSKGGAGSRAMADLWSPVRRMKGSTREIVDPLESMVKNTYTFINLAERNRIAQLLVRQAEKTEGAGQWVEKVSPKMQTTKFSLDEIKTTLENVGFDTDSVSSEALETVATIFRPIARGSQKENIIAVFNDGKSELYQVHPDLYRALKGLDEEGSNILIRVLSKPASALRLGATAISPEFISRNIIRDASTAFLQSRNGFIPGVDTFRGVFHALKRDDLYWEWVRAGGEQAALVSMDRTTLKNNLGDMLASPMQMVVRHPIETLRWLSEMGEAATRLGEYAKARAKGLTPRKAAFEAREVTLDFARMGASTKALNRIVAFWNASVQGTDKFVRVHKENPKGAVAKAVAGVTIPSLILYALNHDDEDYQDLPDWQKDFFWMIPVKGTPIEGLTPFIPVPKPFLWGIVYGSSVERVLDWIQKKDPTAFKGFLNSVEQASLPSFLPTAALPVIEWWANKSMFTGRAIVPGYLERLPEEYQYAPWTSEFSKQTAAMMKKAGVPVSPIKLDNTIFGYSAGAGRAVLNASDMILGGDVKRPTLTLADIPGLRAFALRFPSASTESIQRFYERLGELERRQAARKYAHKYKTGNAPKMTLPEYQEYKYLKRVRKFLSGITVTLRRVEMSRTLSAEEKRIKIDALNWRRVKIARRAVKAIKR